MEHYDSIAHTVTIKPGQWFLIPCQSNVDGREYTAHRLYRVDAIDGDAVTLHDPLRDSIGHDRASDLIDDPDAHRIPTALAEVIQRFGIATAAELMERNAGETVDILTPRK